MIKHDSKHQLFQQKPNSFTVIKLQFSMEDMKKLHRENL